MPPILPAGAAGWSDRRITAVLEPRRWGLERSGRTWKLWEGWMVWKEEAERSDDPAIWGPEEGFLMVIKMEIWNEK